MTETSTSVNHLAPVLTPQEFVKQFNKAINVYFTERNKRKGDMRHFDKEYFNNKFEDVEFIVAMEKFFIESFAPVATFSEAPANGDPVVLPQSVPVGTEPSTVAVDKFGAIMKKAKLAKKKENGKE